MGVVKTFRSLLFHLLKEELLGTITMLKNGKTEEKRTDKVEYS